MSPRPQARLRLALLLLATCAIDVCVGQQAGGAEPPADLLCALEGRCGQLEAMLLADAADGHWDDFSLLAASLVASGVTDRGRLSLYEEQFDRWAVELRRGVAGHEPRRRAEAALDFLHRRALCGGYRVESTDLAAAFDEGRFNCLSATILFNSLARRLGVAVCGLETPGHVKARVESGRDRLDVETTSGDSSANPAAAGAAGGREVSDVQLVAMIYYNRGVDLLAARQFADALAANAKSLRLDSTSAAARANLLAVLNNWAVAEAAAGRYAEAADLLRRGLLLDPGHAAFRANARHVERKWAESRQGK